jgi:hypothetical protein
VVLGSNSTSGRFYCGPVSAPLSLSFHNWNLGRSKVDPSRNKADLGIGPTYDVASTQAILQEGS